MGLRQPLQLREPTRYRRTEFYDMDTIRHSSCCCDCIILLRCWLLATIGRHSVTNISTDSEPANTITIIMLVHPVQASSLSQTSVGLSLSYALRSCIVSVPGCLIRIAICKIIISANSTLSIPLYATMHSLHTYAIHYSLYKNHLLICRILWAIPL